MNRSIFSLEESKYRGIIDRRIEHFMHGWQLVEEYKGQVVDIPGDWDSSIHPVKYFEVIKEEGDVNNSEDENEISLTLWAGWKGYDHEVEINLFIRGRAVNKTTIYHVSAEILKAGGAKMKLYWNDKLVTNFTKKGWFSDLEVDKVWIDNMYVF